MLKRKFDEDLIFGNNYERLIGEQLETLLNIKVDHYNDNEYYDFMMADCLFEVKTDRHNLNTGFFC